MKYKTTKKYIISLFAFFTLGLNFQSCVDLDIPPMNIIQDEEIFGSKEGIMTYVSRMYSEMPIEDFRYSPDKGFNHFWVIMPLSTITGESLSLVAKGAIPEIGCWIISYKLIREINYFLETMPKYAHLYEEEYVKNLIGEARFIRAWTYFEMVKRYGGVPIVDAVINYPEISIENSQLPRNSEEETWDFISKDLDYAIENMSETSVSGRGNKYVAAGLKSRAMLYAASIAKYNETTLYDDNSQKRLCGLPIERANDYFKQSYEAAKLLDSKYSLYMESWKTDDPKSQSLNYTNIFLDENSPENIFVKEYNYPESVHGYDAYCVPRQFCGPNGYSCRNSVTVEYLELFDGIEKDENGHLKTLDENGKYLLFDNTLDLFKNAEPRLSGAVILPGDIYANEIIEIRRGIYTGSVEGGISPLLPEGATTAYPSEYIVSTPTPSSTPIPYQLPDGSYMNPCGKSGNFNAGNDPNAGSFARKYLVQTYPRENRSDQTWIEMRYAEILLNKAEAAYELYTSGEQKTEYLQAAFNCINQIRTRAGAHLLKSPNDLKMNDIRKERRKELAFENKVYWDLRRWRIIDEEQRSRIYRILNPFYAAYANKYFFDIRTDERNIRYTFDTRWYYQEIPASEIQKNSNIVQNPGY